MIYEFLKQLKSGTADESNGRHIISKEAAKACEGIERPKVLDVGAGYGKDLLATRTAIGLPSDIHAIESYPEAVAFLRSQNVNVQTVNLENDRLPFPDNTFDVVICNQVLEHLKEIFWCVSELMRVTKVGGKIIVGVPNLGSLHNRVLLLLGKQPAAIQVFGPHVRGYTASGMRDFLERGGFLKVKDIQGGNFYPFPPSMSRPLSRLFPSLSVSSFYVIERIQPGNFLSVFLSSQARELVDTPYFRG